MLNQVPVCRPGPQTMVSAPSTAGGTRIPLRGLRRGEAAGLRWCDVDLDSKTAVISQQLQQYDERARQADQGLL